MSSPTKQNGNADSGTHADSSQFDEAEVFANALEMDDLHSRNKYLDKIASTNPALRQRLEQLLSYSCSNGEFLESTVADLSSAPSPRLEAIGEWLGPYRLLQQIGEGGMGTVYMAEQVSPLQRRVAIKVIKPGMDSSQVMARFEAERQTLAMMEHPNIARAIDVGLSAYGRTYFVMELVKGVSITRYCDDLGLSIRQRLELFIPVCLAIQHAHQKGIIHRDLKPSNILVAEYDGVPVPKVIDFGVAKALHQQLTSKTLFTQLGQIVGTMEYMSPEQSRLNQLDIDTRSDIYSLGVLLYELLTGTTPIQGQDLKKLSWDEIARRVREEDAPAPSQRLSKLEQIQVVAQQRASVPGKISGLIKGELDWVVLKALEKQRERRYQNATELAADIRRFLQGQEVLACPPSTTYRLKKYLQRYRVAFVTAGLVSVALVLGTIGTAWQAWHASAARQQAEQQRDLATAAAERAQVAQAQAQAEAIKSAREAEITRAVANFVNNDLIAFADPNLEPNRNIRLREIVDRASERMASLQTAPLVEASIRYTLAKCYLGLGQYLLALEHADKSWKIRCESLSPSNPETLSSHLLVAEAQLKLSRISQACTTYEQAVEHCDHNPSLDARMAIDCQHGYAVALGRLGKLTAAMDMLNKVAEFRRRTLGARHAQTLETEREIADILFQQGEYVESLKKFESAITTMTDCLGESHPLTLKTIAAAAVVTAELGDTEEARRKREFIYARQSKVLGDEHPDTLLTASNLTLGLPSGSQASALEKNRQLLTTAQEKLGAGHAVSQAIALTIAELLMDQGHAREAIDYLEKAKAAAQELYPDSSPEVLRVQYRIANCLLFEGKYQTALNSFQQILSEQQTLFLPAHLDTFKTQLAYAIGLMSSGDYRGAEDRLQTLLTTGQNSDLKHHPLLAIAESRLATLESVLGRVSSLTRHQTVRTAFQKRSSTSSSAALQLDIAFAESLLRFGKTGEAKRLLDAAFTTAKSNFSTTHPVCGQIQDSLIEIALMTGDYERALSLSRELLEVRKTSLGIQHPLTLKSHNQLGAILVQSGKPQQGVVLIRSAMEESQRSLGKEFPLTLTYQQNLASTLGLLSVGDPSLRPECLSLFEDLLAIQARWEIDHPDYLFSQLGYAGALGQQGRLLQSERVFAKLLPKLIKIYGESHAFSLRCRENYSSVLGSLGQYPAAIEQCRSYLRCMPSGSIASRKMVHAAIEYHISSGTVTAASDLLEAAVKIATESKGDLAWLFGDVPFFIDAMVQRGESPRAQQTLQVALDLFSERVGQKHPQTLFLAAKLLSLYQQDKQADAASALIKRLEVDAQPAGDASTESQGNTIARIAKAWEATPGIQLVTLYCMAAQASSTEREQESNDFERLAIETLGAYAQRGQLQSRRAQAWLKQSLDLECIRDRQDFQEIVFEVEQSKLIDDTMRRSLNLALVGEHAEAAKILRNFTTEQPALANLGTVHYLMARTWARCHEAAKRDGEGVLATEYMALCNASLASCEEKGFLKTPANRLNLANDENFINVRDQIQSFAEYSSP